MKYEGPNSYQSKDMANVKVFADKDTDKQTGQKATYATDLSMWGHNKTFMPNVVISKLFMVKKYLCIRHCRSKIRLHVLCSLILIYKISNRSLIWLKLVAYKI